MSDSTTPDPDFGWLGPDPVDPVWMRDDDEAKGADKNAGRDEGAQKPKGGAK